MNKIMKKRKHIYTVKRQGMVPLALRKYKACVTHDFIT